MKIKKICKQCGKQFKVVPSKKNRAKYCSKDCANKAKIGTMRGILSPRWNRIKIKCAWCGKSIERTRSWIKKTEHSFCNLKCYGNYYHIYPAKGVGGKKGEHPSLKTEFKKGIRYGPETEFKKGDIYFKERWKDNHYLFKYFHGHLFPNISRSQLTKLDKKIIRTRIRLFKIQRKEVMTDETNRI